MNLEGNSPIPEPARPMFEDCTVTSVDPLEIQRDCDESPIPFTPDTMIAPELLAVEDRVRVELAGERLIVVGRGNGFAVDSEATAGALMLRDASGRSQATDPSADADIATKGYVDDEIADLDLIVPKAKKPSSVDHTSGSASSDSSGLVTVSGVSLVRLNGVFDGLGGDIYQVVFSLDGTTNQRIYVRLAASGTDHTASDYNDVYNYNYSPTSNNTSSQFPINYLVNLWAKLYATAPVADGRIMIYTPGVAGRYTQAEVTAVGAASNRFLWREYGQAPAAAYDGLTIATDAGTFTGTIKVVKLA